MSNDQNQPDNQNPPSYPGQPAQPDQQGSPYQGGAQQPYGSAPQPYSPGQNDPATGKPPSKAMAITGFVLSFFGLLAIVGLILNIISFRRFGRAGQPRGLSLAGIIISIVVIIVSVFSIIALVAAFSYGLEMCNDLGSGTHNVDGVQVTCP
ncbi:DUF4190 domain-containing protein [Frigoribacterium faeni]|uniref:DUF4190 domain-containing protein n=1 Tax=Frigoribacterium faeni TaxID=145483 RepID=A0A7W3JKF1_9MICO|nr:DUF4190 domain-containing protein [Frigoribacterium faeni]MBA8814532.1 hypothetical protein [Frigoribacterium faeni]BFF15956.1 hypothetical protein GCM10025699_72590 [Microbacterium flavescens]GEK84773.1 hypothetical protein FFA01_30820 [Frigoribacterium faeni]